MLAVFVRRIRQFANLLRVTASMFIELNNRSYYPYANNSYNSPPPFELVAFSDKTPPSTCFLNKSLPQTVRFVSLQNMVASRNKNRGFSPYLPLIKTTLGKGQGQVSNLYLLAKWKGASWIRTETSRQRGGRGFMSYDDGWKLKDCCHFRRELLQEGPLLVFIIYFNTHISF